MCIHEYLHICMCTTCGQCLRSCGVWKQTPVLLTILSLPAKVVYIWMTQLVCLEWELHGSSWHILRPHRGSFAWKGQVTSVLRHYPCPWRSSLKLSLICLVLFCRVLGWKRAGEFGCLCHPITCFMVKNLRNVASWQFQIEMSL